MQDWKRWVAVVAVVAGSFGLAACSDSEPDNPLDPDRFSDRPHRLTGHIATSDFVDSWGEGEDSFAANPPNALLSIFTKDEVLDVVVVVGDPTLSNGDLTHSVEVLDGELVPSSEPVNLFIDVIGRPFTPMSVGGVTPRPQAGAPPHATSEEVLNTTTRRHAATRR